MVAAVLFTLAVAGVFSTIGQMQKPALASRQKSVSAAVGKDVLEKLRQAVATGWDSGTLSVGTHNCSEVISVPAGIGSCLYEVSQPSAGAPRQVTLHVNDTE